MRGRAVASGVAPRPLRRPPRRRARPGAAAVARLHLPSAAPRQRPARRRQGRDRRRGDLHRRRSRRAGKTPLQPPRLSRPNSWRAAAARPQRKRRQPKAAAQRRRTAVFKVTIPADAPLGVSRRAPRQQVGRQQRPHLRRRRPDRSPRKRAEQRRAPGPARRTEHHHQRHDGHRRRRRLLRLRRQEGPARRLQLPGLHHRQPLHAGVEVYDAKGRLLAEPAATTPATTPWPTAPCPTTAITTSACSSSRTRPTSPAARPNTSTASRSPPPRGSTRFIPPSSSRASRRR